MTENGLEIAPTTGGSWQDWGGLTAEQEIRARAFALNGGAVADVLLKRRGDVSDGVGVHLGVGFGRRNAHCSNCGDERGGPVGHEISECKYRSGMTVPELAATMPPDKASEYLNAAIDAYFAHELGR